MQQEDADLLAVGAARDLRRVGGLVDGDAHVPVEPERLDAEDVFGLAQRQTGLGEDRVGAREDVLARDAFRRLPAAEFRCDVHGQLLTYLLLRQHQAGVSLGVHRDRASGRQVGFAVQQALQLDLAAA